MVAANASQPQAVLFRYWLTSFLDFDGGLADQSIRIEFADITGVRRSALGQLVEHRIRWTLGSVVPACLDSAAAECAMDACERGVPGCEFEGQQDEDEMARNVSRMCLGCGEYAPSQDWLSTSGHCGKCFCQHAPQWLETLRTAGAL